MMNLMSLVLSRPIIFNTIGWLARKLMMHMPVVVNNQHNTWYKNREMPAPPMESFTEWYKKNMKNGKPE